MPRRFGPALAIALVAALSASLPALAQETPLSRLALSKKLFDEGAAARDPLLMAAAAKLRKSVRAEPGTIAGDGAAEPGGEEAAPLGWEAMLSAAEAAAGDDTGLLGLIADIRAERGKGVATGPIYSILKIAPRRSSRFGPLPFAGDDYAEVYLEGDGASDLNLYVVDSAGRLVCSDTDISDIAYCGWYPDRDDDFSFRVENAGGAASTFSVMTN